MNCPKCGLTINGSASYCPRCLNKIPTESQNTVPQNNRENNTGSGNGFHKPDYQQSSPPHAPQQNFNQQQIPLNQNLQDVNNDSPFYWIGQVFKKYAIFRGRARRKEYWLFFLMSFIVNMFFSFMAMIEDISILIAVLSLIFSLAIMIPSWAVLVRRLHDTGRSGAYVLFLLIPIVGVIILIVYLAKDSVPGDNQYGPYPK
jgi:uncharacterized membrane protein YhaH (DUF805 family)